MPGCGKSAIGRNLAVLCEVSFVTVDAEIEKGWSMTVSELFAERGEETFRLLEANAIEEAIGAHADAVISVGGGAVTTARSREAIARADCVVWLRARLDTLQRRVGDGRKRPLLAGDVARRLHELCEAREDLYASLATVVIDVDGKSQRQVTALVQEALL